MSVLRTMTWGSMSEADRARLCSRGLADIFDPGLRASIADLVEDVRVNGDDAVCRALAKFDGVTLRADQLAITPEAIATATVSADLEAALAKATSNLRTFNEKVVERSSNWTTEIQPGLSAGERVTPISSAGLFVPSGKASYPSVAYQLGVPAVVAGVPDIALLVPPEPGTNGGVDPAILVVCRMLGISRVYRANGPAGIAALGFGTATIAPVRKIVGPGSPAVTCAQVEMQRHGVATMMLLGPTESLVIADDSADPVRLAADLLIEAEHGTDSSVVLVTTSASLVDAVDVELERQLAALPAHRAGAARASLGPNGGAVLVSTLDEAAAVANRYAPEHLQVAVDESSVDRVVDMLMNAGEILVGQHTPFSAGNFLIGCPASLPTSGFAHVSSGITAETFLKRTAVARATESALRDMSRSIVTLATHEGFPAHANAITKRFETKDKS
ncbi:MAG: histidinol dehydrogenase [Actinobacteria bacterium]|nr:histidinol dehydrogenase [Actinomycetota bacterium]